MALTVTHFAWLVVFSSFIALFLPQANAYSNGMLCNETFVVVSTGGDQPKSSQAYIGIILTNLAAFAGAFGKVLMKKAQNSCIWYVPALFCIVIMNPVGDIYAYQFATTSVLVPFSAMSIVWACIFAPCVLGEKVTKKDVVGIVIVVIGVVLVAIAGRTDSPEYTTEQLHILFTGNFTFIIYITIDAALLTFMCLVMFFTWPKPKDPSLPSGWEKSDFNGFPLYTNRKLNLTQWEPPASCFSPVQNKLDQTRAFCLKNVISETSVLRKICFAAAGGLLGGNLFMVKVLVASFATAKASDYSIYIIIIFTGIVVGGGLFLLGKGMVVYDAVFCIPLYQCGLIVVGSASAAAYFRDWSGFQDDTTGLYFNNYCGFQPWQFGVFPVGLVLCLVGIVILSYKPKSVDPVAQKQDIELENLKSADSSASEGEKNSPKSRESRYLQSDESQIQDSCVVLG